MTCLKNETNAQLNAVHAIGTVRTIRYERYDANHRFSDVFRGYRNVTLD